MSVSKEYSYVGEELEVAKEANNWKKYFSSEIANYITGDILEVGAGIGSNTNELMSKAKAINSWTLIEPDTEFYKIVQSKDFHHSCEIINGYIDNAQDQKYDCILYIDVLEHISNTDDEIKAIIQKLKPGGYLIILVPAYQSLYTEFDKAIGHVKRYNKKQLQKEINNHLEITKLFYLDSVGVCASIVNKVCLKKSNLSKKNISFWDKILVPISRVTDKLTFNLFGKSLVGIYKKPQND